jgi:hypothetical protein
MKHILQRIQRKRLKGWKMPPNTVYVGRGSKWGNPFRVVQYSDGKWAVKCDSDERQAEILTSTCRFAYDTKQEAQADAVRCYAIHLGSLKEGSWNDFFVSEMIDVKLRGKNLACWCAPGDPCHADLLLKIANT